MQDSVNIQNLKILVDRLHETGRLTKPEWVTLIGSAADHPESSENRALFQYIFTLARQEQHRYYGHDIYVRGLIEFTNYCKNDCLYCGIRKSSPHVRRYRLCDAEILDCCREGYALGFRTFVLQGGEDPYFTDERLVPLIKKIRQRYPDCAITLSVGERPYASYKALFDAGADRYLLRHETADPAHYAKLHPASLRAEDRQKCLWDLKEIGYQVGAGFMVGSPYQTPENLAEDMLFLTKLNPQMVGIGPFIPAHGTPFAKESAGSLELTLFLLGLIRLLLPKALLPATTALGTIHPKGREMGILAGANVLMPNLSPTQVRKDYLLYDNKICTGDESARCRACLERRVEAVGYHIVTARGDSLNI